MTASIERSANTPVPVPASTTFGFKPGWLVGNLPVVMSDDPFTARFVTIFEEIASSVRFSVESSADAADLSVTTGRMIDYLGHWLETPGRNSDLGVDVQRAIVQADSRTIRARGTIGALRELLEAVTGADVVVRDTGGIFRTGEAPEAGGTLVVELSARGHLADADLVDLVRAETPAHLPIAVFVDGHQISRAITPDPTPERTLA